MALAIVLRGGVGSPPPTSSKGIQLGEDGLPVAIGGERVLRGDEIAAWLADPSATGAVLAGRDLVVPRHRVPERAERHDLHRDLAARLTHQ